MFGFKAITTTSKNASLYVLSLGVLLILFGILFIIWPELLAYLISFFFILVGIILIAFSWRIRMFQKKVSHTAQHFTDAIKDTFGRNKSSLDEF